MISKYARKDETQRFDLLDHWTLAAILSKSFSNSTTTSNFFSIPITLSNCFKQNPILFYCRRVFDVHIAILPRKRELDADDLSQKTSSISPEFYFSVLFDFLLGTDFWTSYKVVDHRQWGRKIIIETWSNSVVLFLILYCIKIFMKIGIIHETDNVYIWTS